VHRRLLNLEEEKTRVLLSGDAGKLTPLLNDQQALLMQSRELEKQRNAICLGTEYKTLRELIESGGEYKALFGTIFEELTAVVMALKRKCALNKKLLETRLGTIRFLLNQSGKDPGANTYTKNVNSRW
jgi:hypothetical protein